MVKFLVFSIDTKTGNTTQHISLLNMKTFDYAVKTAEELNKLVKSGKCWFKEDENKVFFAVIQAV